MIREPGQRISNIFAVIVPVVFFVIYCSISIYNHYVFRTFAFDLGIKNQAIWDYAHFRYNYNTVMPELIGRINILANHFEPIMFLIAPLYWAFGSYTLLVVQILAVLLGGFGVYKYVKTLEVSPLLPAIAMASFYSTWAIFAALAFDFHTNVLGAMLVPWILYCFAKHKLLQAFILVFLLVNCKENMALWTVFIGLGLAVQYRKDRSRKLASLGVSGLGIIYFLLIMKVFMPYYADGKLAYLHFQYSALGENMSEAVKTIVTRPVSTFRLLFENHLPEYEAGDGIKWALHAMVLLSGGVFLFFRPHFLIMLIPVYAQKMFSDDPIKWGYFNQYSIEFVPIMAIAAFSFIASWKNYRIQLLMGCLVLLSVMDISKGFIGGWLPSPYRKTQLKFYSPEHFTREFPVNEMHKLLESNIPENASVSATSFIVPHIADRKNIRQFPDGLKSDFIVLGIDGKYYTPGDSLMQVQTLQLMRDSSAWTIKAETPSLIIFERR